MSGLLNNPPITARQLAEKLLAVNNPDAPVFVWSPGACWEVNLGSIHNHQVGPMPYSWVMIELDACSRVAANLAAKEAGV